jgi:hypothetical protein
MSIRFRWQCPEISCRFESVVMVCWQIRLKSANSHGTGVGARLSRQCNAASLKKP